LCKIDKLAPFGEGNEEPTFLLENTRINKVEKVGSNGKWHLKIHASHGEEKITSLFWGKGEEACYYQIKYISLVGKIKKDTYNGEFSWNEWIWKKYKIRLIFLFEILYFCKCLFGVFLLLWKSYECQEDIHQIEKEIQNIKARNKRVEADKKWETSWIRKISIAVLTYIVIVIFFFSADISRPFINAIVPNYGIFAFYTVIGCN
jgi:hypothetical protein